MHKKYQHNWKKGIKDAKKFYNNTEICQSSNYLHTETETMKLRKFDYTNIENPVNNASSLKDILQNNDLYSVYFYKYS